MCFAALNPARGHQPGPGKRSAFSPLPLGWSPVKSAPVSQRSERLPTDSVLSCGSTCTASLAAFRPHSLKPIYCDAGPRLQSARASASLSALACLSLVCCRSFRSPRGGRPPAGNGDVLPRSGQVRQLFSIKSDLSDAHRLLFELSCTNAGRGRCLGTNGSGRLPNSSRTCRLEWNRRQLASGQGYA